MFFLIDRAIDMVEKKLDYLRKAVGIPFPKISFPSKLDVFFKNQTWFFQNLAKSANFGPLSPKT